MKKIDFGQTINTLANVGVLFGIVFLAIEVGQNQASLDEANAINRATATTAAVDGINGYRTLLLLNDEIREMWTSGLSGADLSEGDARKFELMCANNIWMFILMHERYELLGLHDRAQGAVRSWSAALNDPGLRECWERRKANARSWGYDSFVTAVENFEVP